MLGYPVLSALFDGQGLARFLFQLLAVMLDLADLFDHACAKQGVLIDEGNAHQVIVFLASAPGYYPWITRLIAEQWNAQLDRRTAAKAA